METKQAIQRPPYLSAAESSKALKAELVAAFPGVKFRTRMSRGTGYGTVYIDWTDGPTLDEVQAISRRWQGKSFDGMDDSTHYHDREVTYKGQTYLSGLGYVFETRHFSAERLAEAKMALAQADWTPKGPEQIEEAARWVARGQPVWEVVARMEARPY